MKRVALLAFAAVFAVGCGAGRVPVYPVSGRLTINGKTPPEGWVAMLHLEPAPGSLQDLPHPLPRAKVQADGRFQFRTYEAADGVPAGTYKISFIDTGSMRSQGGKRDQEDQDDTKDKNAKGEKKTTQVYWPTPIEIRPEVNELPPFDIKQ